MSRASRRRPARRPRRKIYLTTVAMPLALLIILGICLYFTKGNSGGLSDSYPNLSRNAAGVTCANAPVVADEFGNAVSAATQATPDYTGIQAFGFAPPLSPAQVNSLQSLLRARLSQVRQQAQAVSNGTCTNNPTASVTDTYGQVVTLPVVYGQQPGQPLSGTQSNQDGRTVPVTVGTSGDHQRTNTWSALNALYGGQSWYTSCANTILGVHWETDAPRFITAESGGQGVDSRFILAVNTTLTDTQVRAKAAADGNPNVGKLLIVRTPAIINTRHLAGHRCDQFIDERSMVRVSLGIVTLDPQGNPTGIRQMDRGIFVDCHNMWQLPRTRPVPTKPTPTPTSTHPGTTPPGTTPPTTTPPTTPPTTPTPKCTNGGTPPKCLQPKDPKAGAGSKGNVPTPVRGTNPPVTSSPQPKPSSPPSTYSAPPPPAPTALPAPRSSPPPQSPAPQPSNPATGTACPPGIPSC